MALEEYKRKRKFEQTPEPPPKVEAKVGHRFVVQKHDATRLHYDFRLELEGVLKSWAVPKGPSLDPADKRLAMHVEDHPLEYGEFEGIIPKGQYGGGTVLLWDRGTWEPVGDPHKSYRAGSLKFTLKGEKLHGGWALVKIGGRRKDGDDRSWLLIKERDQQARPGQAEPIVASEPKSVATGRTIEQIAAAGDRVWHSNRDGGDRSSLDPVEVPGARRTALPKFVQPQLATLVERPPEGDGWLHELKHDGYRILARVEHHRAQLFSRNAHDWTEKFPTVAEALGRLPVEQAILDGEITVLLPDGTSSFQALQNFGAAAARGQLAYMVFDLLYLDGRDLTGARLEDRKAALARLLASANDRAAVLRYSDHVVGTGADFFAHACKLGLEGILSKKRDAPYRGTRGPEWLKIKCLKQQEIVIGGYTEPEGSRIVIGALLGGVYESGRLVYVGKIGTGFDNRMLRDLQQRLSRLEQKTSPFASRPAGPARAHWVKPELVPRVSCSEGTSAGKLRHPAFQGRRQDKPADAVVRERPATTEDHTTKEGEMKRIARAPRSTRPAKTTAEAVVAGVRLTHADRILYPSHGTTKLDLAPFYQSIAQWILPHLEDRPTTLVRCPEGAHKTCFYQRHVGYWAPESLRRVKIQEKRKVGEYLVVDSLASLIGLVQIGILEIHTWNSVVKRLEQPDRVVFDLDPRPGVQAAQVIEVARLIRHALLTLEHELFLQTTGGHGLTG